MIIMVFVPTFLKGKDGELFESNYLNEYMQIPGAASDEYLEEMSEKILQLRSLLEKKNIKLLLFLIKRFVLPIDLIKLHMTL